MEQCFTDDEKVSLGLEFITCASEGVWVELHVARRRHDLLGTRSIPSRRPPLDSFLMSIYTSCALSGIHLGRVLYVIRLAWAALDHTHRLDAQSANAHGGCSLSMTRFG